MRASGRRFRPAVAIGERGVVLVLPGFGRVAAQLYENDVKSPLFGPEALKYFMMMAF